MRIFRFKYLLLLALFMLFVPLRSAAQYYSWGADDVNLRWSEIKQSDVSIVYPDSTDAMARRVLMYINTVQGDITYGYQYPPLNIPFVVHPQNFYSNALVMFMPKRIDFLSTPDVDGFSTLWTKHLVAHEYRHAVQYNTLNQGWVKAASYILGQQGSVLGLLYMPLFAIEGDAVWMETQMSTYGRGKQPSFSMAYRAIGREEFESRPLDTWMCGSYNHFVPDHYSLGYQVVSYAYTNYDKYVWSRVGSYGVRHPWDLWYCSRTLRKWYGVDKVNLIKNSFDNLYSYWESLPSRENSTEIISEIDTKNYTTYLYPQIVDGGDVVAVKSDYNTPSRLVRVDSKSLDEQRVTYTGSLSSSMTYRNNRLWWSEYRYSKLFDQKVGSQICLMDIDGKTRKPSTVKGHKATLYPTPIGEDGASVAYVEYDYAGYYSIVECNVIEERRGDVKLEERSRVALPSPTEIHGLAWDNTTDGVYFIATDDSGMWIGEVDLDGGEYRQLRPGAFVSISNLRAEDGSLFYGSIESGYDEIHRYDLLTDKEYRVTESQYGSFSPSTMRDGVGYAATYNRYGYHLARMRSGEVEQEVEYTHVPQNIVNPPHVKWDVVNLDNVSFTPADSVESHKVNKSRKYNKGLKLFDVHSWFPFAFTPYNITFEQVLDITWGATLLSQNLLSNTDGYISYGYSGSEGSVVKGSINSRILGLDINVSGSYGGDQLSYLQGETYIIDGTSGYFNGESAAAMFDKRYYSIGSSLSLPLLFDGGYHLRRFTPSLSWSYNNGLVPDLDNVSINPTTGDKVVNLKEGVHAMSFAMSFSDWTRSASRDFLSPFSYSLLSSYTTSPNDRHFSDLVSLYGSVTKRAFLPQCYLSLAMNYQTSVGGESSNGVACNLFKSVRLLPVGFTSSDINNDNYIASSVTLNTSLFSPDRGIDGIVYFKRVRLDASVMAAQFNDWGGIRQRIYSYGGAISVDLNILRMPAASTVDVRFGIYAPSSGGLAYQFGLNLPI